MGGYGGHSGAFGDLEDLMSFSKKLFEDFPDGNILNKLWSRAPYPKNCERTLGWDTPSGTEPSFVSRRDGMG